MEVHFLAFELILGAAKDKGLPKGKTIGVDATDLEANASMKSAVRKGQRRLLAKIPSQVVRSRNGISNLDDEELRSFAHVCDTGGVLRTWLRGPEKVHKRDISAAISHNLGRIMRSLIGAGKPRYTAVLAERLCFVYFNMEAIANRLTNLWTIP